MVDTWDAGRDDEVLLLDLLNSRPVVAGAERDALGTEGDGRAWLRCRGLVATTAALAEAWTVREVLGQVVQGRALATALEGFVADLRARVVLDGDGARWVLTDDANAVGVRAVLAWAALARAAPGRLRACENPECRLFLLDRSRAGTARWCSMATCGNRMKARRHHARTRE